jgi:hypothetical protein
MTAKKRQRAARKSEAACYAHTVAHLHAEAAKIEPEALSMMISGRLHEAHQKLDVARALRMAANYLEGTQGA